MASFRQVTRRRGAVPTASVPATDPWPLLRRHADALAMAARDILAAVPDAELAGLIVAPGARHGEELRALLYECHGNADPDRTCVGLVPRERLGPLLPDGILQALGSASLPILIASSLGLRATSVACAPTPPPESATG